MVAVPGSLLGPTDGLDISTTLSPRKAAVFSSEIQDDIEHDNEPTGEWIIPAFETTDSVDQAVCSEPGDSIIHKGANLGRGIAAFGMDDMDRQGFSLIFL